MEMTCESVDDDNCSLEFVADDNFDQNSIPSPSKLPFSLLSPLKHVKTSTDCFVPLERLPKRLVGAAQRHKAFIMKSNPSSKTDPTPMSRLPGREVKTEPISPEDGEYAPYLYPADNQPSVALNQLANMASASRLVTNRVPVSAGVDHSYASGHGVSKMRVSAPNFAWPKPNERAKRLIPAMGDTSPVVTGSPGVAGASVHAANSAGVKPRGMERDISVIILKSAWPPKVTADMAPHELSAVVLNMLQQQNISPFSASNNNTGAMVIREEGSGRWTVQGSSSAASAEYANTQQVGNSSIDSAVEMKLKMEQAKVRYLLQQVASLKDTVKGLLHEKSANSSDLECTTAEDCDSNL